MCVLLCVEPVVGYVGLGAVVVCLLVVDVGVGGVVMCVVGCVCSGVHW